MSKRVPIYLMTYERVEYFSKTVPFLLDTNKKIKLLVYDNFSKGRMKVALMRYWSDHNRVVLRLQPKNIKPFRLLLKIWEDAFSDPSAEYCIHIQDDVVVHPQWLQKLLEAKEQIPNLGILSPCDRSGEVDNNKGWSLRPYKKDMSKVLIGCCWLTTREFYKKVTSKYIPVPPNGLSEDSYFIKRCQQLGFNMAATNPSWAKHIGVESIARPGIEIRECQNLAEGL